MKRLSAFCASLGLFLMANPMTALAAEQEGGASASSVPLWMCIPFAGLLLCIAILPLVKAEWWEEHQPHAVALWSILFIIPFAMRYSAGTALETVLECLVNDYLTFIILLFGLFCVAGNITMSGDLAGSPRVNVGLLALGTLLSSWIGTTGASMLMIRPVVKMNAWRKKKRHIIIFFIFLVSNIGGCLPPIGDPPLLMGFMRGVPFFWSLHLAPILFFNMLIPSGYSKAAILLPLVCPVGDILGVTREIIAQIYCIGDSLTNTLTPVSSPLVGALGIAEVEYTDWLKYAVPLIGILIGIACVIICILSGIGWVG